MVLVMTNISDKLDKFDFDIVCSPFLDGDSSRRSPFGVYISQLIRFARESPHVSDLNSCDKALKVRLSVS